MKWEGIQRGSIDVGASNEALEVVNGRFVTTGELRRRRGMARTNIIKKGAAIGTLSGFSAFQSNVMCALTDADRIQGYQQPAALWGDNPTYLTPARWLNVRVDQSEGVTIANPRCIIRFVQDVYSGWSSLATNILGYLDIELSACDTSPSSGTVELVANTEYDWTFRIYVQESVENAFVHVYAGYSTLVDAIVHPVKVACWFDGQAEPAVINGADVPLIAYPTICSVATPIGTVEISPGFSASFTPAT
jgi:hypothetical protein